MSTASLSDVTNPIDPVHKLRNYFSLRRLWPGVWSDQQQHIGGVVWSQVYLNAEPLGGRVPPTERGDWR
jgi:hypothetical protein